MCFSAKIRPDPYQLARDFDAQVDLLAFERLYTARAAGERIKTPKGLDDALRAALGTQYAALRGAIDAWNAAQAVALQQEVFAQKQRQAAAERALAVRPTKKAADDLRISTDRIERALGRLVDLRRAVPETRDARIFPGVYAPVLVEEGDRRWVRPMRYQCRPAGKPASYDTRFPGMYNARRDNLQGFWKDLFGHTHALMVVDRFFEHVQRIGDDGRPHNVVLEFQPDPPQDMLVACLWSRWTDPAGIEPDLLSFAAITDEPPAEVAAAGHDRCIIQIDPADVDAWLRPDPARLADAFRIFDARPRPIYGHRLAA